MRSKKKTVNDMHANIVYRKYYLNKNNEAPVYFMASLVLYIVVIKIILNFLLNVGIMYIFFTYAFSARNTTFHFRSTE